jgi:elongation factor G
MAMKDAFEQAASVLLEPVMDVEVVVPDEFVGAIQGDLNSRRGDITGFELRAGAQVVTAEVPLASMFGYVNDLRSMTQGRGTYTMQFLRYAEAPQSVREKLVFH